MKSSAIVFVHGLFSSSAAWDELATLLAGDKEIAAYYDLHRFEYDTPRVRLDLARRIPSLTAIAESLGEYLSEQLGSYTRLVLISHSQGGLIVQRYLSRSLADGRGPSLSRIRRIMMFACPNNGSEFFLQIRKRSSLFWTHRQERELRPLSEEVLDSQRRVLMGVVHSATVASDRCPIPLVTFAAASDNIVTHASAASVFTDAHVLPGTHRSVIRPTSSNDLTYVTVKNHLVRALAEPFPISTSESVIPSVIEIPDQIFELRSDDPIAVPLGRGGSVACVLHAGPIDQLENVDIIVVSENVYLQMAHFFKPSISGRIRLAAARRAEGGEILEDIAQRELDDWVRRNGKLGLPLPRGAVASTSPGALASQGVSRLFHAAVAEYDRESHSYFVKPETIGVAVHRIFELARQERERFPDLRSICLPLLGAGRGGLDASTSFNLIWEAAKRELEREPELWELHFIAWRADQIQLIRGRLTEKIVIDVESSTEEARTDA